MRFQLGQPRGEAFDLFLLPMDEFRLPMDEIDGGRWQREQNIR